MRGQCENVQPLILLLCSYDPISFFAIHTAFGTPDDLKYLVNEAHARGMSVIFDFVCNHMHQRRLGREEKCAHALIPSSLLPAASCSIGTAPTSTFSRVSRGNSSLGFRGFISIH